MVKKDADTTISLSVGREEVFAKGRLSFPVLPALLSPLLHSLYSVRELQKVILWQAYWHLPAGINASQYSHLKYFPSVDAYNNYYDIVVYICDFGPSLVWKQLLLVARSCWLVIFEQTTAKRSQLGAEIFEQSPCI